MDKAEFEIRGTLTRIFPGRSGKVTRFAVKAQGTRLQEHDIVYFGSLPGYQRGDYVLVKGEPGREKLEGVQEQWKDGSMHDRWVTILVATHVEAMERAQRSIVATQAPAKRPDDDIPF